MANKIISGFPLHPCSWLYAPVAPASLIRAAIRWLDSACAAETAEGRGTHRKRFAPEPKATIHGT